MFLRLRRNRDFFPRSKVDETNLCALIYRRTLAETRAHSARDCPLWWWAVTRSGLLSVSSSRRGPEEGLRADLGTEHVS